MFLFTLSETDDIVKRAISLSHSRSQNNSNNYDKDQVIDLCNHLVKFVSSLDDEDVQRERISQALLDNGLLDVLKDPKLLAETNSSMTDESFRTIYAQTVAELAKVGECLVSFLVNMLYILCHYIDDDDSHEGPFNMNHELYFQLN